MIALQVLVFISILIFFGIFLPLLGLFVQSLLMDEGKEAGKFLLVLLGVGVAIANSIGLMIMLTR